MRANDTAITVNGHETGRNSDLIVIIRPALAGANAGAVAAAEQLVRDLTGRAPFAFADGTGTWAVGASRTTG